MSAELDRYLVQVYRRDVMGESVVVVMPEADKLAEIEAEIARIDALRLGAHLANRDFAAYQSRRALVKLRDYLKAQQREEPKQLEPPKPKEEEEEHAHEPS